MPVVAPDLNALTPPAGGLVTRFAPSPTGLLHLGHAFSALTAFQRAQDAGGRVLLRIEDIDEGRCRPEFEAAIFEDLAWLGIAWETPAMRQSERRGAYGDALDRMREAGLLYRCFRTRREVMAEIERAPHLAAEGPEGPAFFPGPPPEAEEAERLAAGDAFAWRLSIARCRAALGDAADALAFEERGAGPNGETGRIGVDIALFGDAVVARKDAGVSYHLAVVVDDAAQGVTEVVRGADLHHAAHIQRLLQALLGLPAPAYRHHRLLTDETGKRLAKRHDALSLKAMRDAGETPRAVRARLGFD